ncbi:MAG TPA: PAS domain S-box protein [Dermatophilaceae bacterium]|nr:PAS domain S-box protein [Dermatophilaceae bacterium]
MPSTTTKFEKLLEAVPDALVGMNQKGMIRFVNRQTEWLFDCDRDDLIGQHIETLVPEPLWQIYAQNRDQYFADPGTRSIGLEVELVGRRRDGTEFPINVTLSYIDTGDVLLVITAVADVTKRMLAVRSAELIAAIVEYSDDAIMSATLEGILTSWNPAAEKMYGYTSKEVIGRSGRILTPDDLADEWSANLAKAKAGHPVDHFETERVRKDGTSVPVSLTLAPIHDEDGAIVGVSVAHRDVTEQRRALELAQRIEAIVEGSDDAIIGETPEGVITSWNPAATRMFGYSGEEIVGKSVDLLIPEGHAGAAKAVAAKVSAGQHVEHLETFNVRKDGTVFPVSLTVSPVRGVDGAIVGASVICRDMTEQRRAADYARSLIEAGPDPLMTISPEGRITDVNEATVKATGVARSDLIGTSYFEYFTDRDKATEGYEQVFAQGSVTSYPLTMRHRDGTLTSLLCTASLYRDSGGNVLGVLATGRDVTGQRAASEAARRMAAIVEGSDDAIISRTLDGIIESWNPAATTMFGYTSEEIVGESVGLLVPPERAGETISILARLSAGKPVRNFETVRLRKDGTPLTVSLTISPMRDDKDVVVGASVICRDITEVRHEAQYARSLIEASLDPMETISPEGKITDVNEAAVKATGRPRHKLIGTDFARYFTDPDKARQGYHRVFEQGSATGYPLTLRHRDGTLTDFLCNASVYRDAAGNVLGVLAVAREKAS